MKSAQMFLLILAVIGFCACGGTALAGDKGGKGKAAATTEISAPAASETKEALQWKAKYLAEFMSSRTQVVNDYVAAKKELDAVNAQLKEMEEKKGKK